MNRNLGAFEEREFPESAPLLLDAASTSSFNSTDPFSDLLSAPLSDPLSAPLSALMSASVLSISPLPSTSIKKCFFQVSIKKCFFPVARFTSNVRTRRSGQQSKKKLFIVETNKENASLSLVEVNQAIK